MNPTLQSIIVMVIGMVAICLFMRTCVERRILPIIYVPVMAIMMFGLALNIACILFGVEVTTAARDLIIN